MKVIDIINKIDKSKENEYSVDVEVFSREFDYDFQWVEQEKLKCYWVASWCCTDDYVGTRMYFYNDTPVAISTQTGRKSDEYFNWFSKELALTVREYLISLMGNGEDGLRFDICDMNEEIGDSYKICYNGNLISSNKPYLNNKPIEILEQLPDKRNWGIGTKLKIKLDDGSEQIVDITDLDFKFYIND